jgi:hypothetical protein
MMEYTAAEMDLMEFDYVLLAESGGKDSTWCAILLEELERAGKIRKGIIEWHHHDVGPLMDWPVTRAYNVALAKYFERPLYFSWKVGGFKREMLRDGDPTAPTRFETPEGTVVGVGGKGPPGRHMVFPQVSADLSVRWCSAYLKIDILTALIRNSLRFLGKKVLVITGERRQESAARAKYKAWEKHKSSNKNREVWQWRPALDTTEKQVWGAIEEHQIRAHPAYYLGWGRLSCMTCIFGSKHQWASANVVDPEKVKILGEYEEQFGKTIQRRKSVPEMVAEGTPYTMKKSDVALARGTAYDEDIYMKNWMLPSGAFGESTGPT